MARRSVTGQLNMFDLFNNLGTPGEVQMVSLMPEDEPEEVIPEPEVVPNEEVAPNKEVVPDVEVTSAPAVVSAGDVAMCRTYEVNGMKVEIAYINYNKVRITKGKKSPEIKEFASTKEAVDYYVEKMQELELDE